MGRGKQHSVLLHSIQFRGGGGEGKGQVKEHSVLLVINDMDTAVKCITHALLPHKYRQFCRLGIRFFTVFHVAFSFKL